MLIPLIKNFPYKKISFYRPERKIIFTFDFPKVIEKSFLDIIDKFYQETGFLVEKNDNINNIACENVIYSLIGKENIDKISYLPLEDKFKIKVYENPNNIEEITNRIGYEILVELVTKPKKTPITSIIPGQKLEQNVALNFIEEYFSLKKHHPYKKSLKNTNMVMIFNELNEILNSLEIVKIKNPSYLPNENKVAIKIEPCSEGKLTKLKQLFLEQTGLEINIE